MYCWYMVLANTNSEYEIRFAYVCIYKYYNEIDILTTNLVHTLGQ